MIVPGQRMPIVIATRPVDFRNYAESKIMRSLNEHSLEICSLSGD